jgi:hypothetical protein
MGTVKLYREVLGRMRPHLGTLIFAIASVAAASLVEVLKPWPLKIVIDNVLRGAPPRSGLPSGHQRRLPSQTAPETYRRSSSTSNWTSSRRCLTTSPMLTIPSIAPF